MTNPVSFVAGIRIACALALGMTAWIRAAQAEPVAAPALAPAKIWQFAGAWTKPFVPGVVKSGIIPLNSAYQAKLEHLQQLSLNGEEVPGNEEKCVPNGMPMMMKFGFQILADASRMVLVSSIGQIRYIWTDGRVHTPDNALIDSYTGESVSHWDGDTLVVDTRGLKSTNELEFGLAPSKMHIIERWRLISPRQLEVGVTIEDPLVLIKPWSYVTHYTRTNLNSDIQYCVAAVDRAVDRATGKQGFDLTPPAGGYIPPGASQ